MSLKSERDDKISNIMHNYTELNFFDKLFFGEGADQSRKDDLLPNFQ